MLLPAALIVLSAVASVCAAPAPVATHITRLGHWPPPTTTIIIVPTAIERRHKVPGPVHTDISGNSPVTCGHYHRCPGDKSPPIMVPVSDGSFRECVEPFCAGHETLQPMLPAFVTIPPFQGPAPYLRPDPTAASSPVIAPREPTKPSRTLPASASATMALARTALEFAEKSSIKLAFHGLKKCVDILISGKHGGDHETAYRCALYSVLFRHKMRLLVFSDKPKHKPPQLYLRLESNPNHSSAGATPDGFLQGGKGKGKGKDVDVLAEVSKHFDLRALSLLDHAKATSQLASKGNITWIHDGIIPLSEDVPERHVFPTIINILGAYINTALNKTPEQQMAQEQQMHDNMKKNIENKQRRNLR